jgi:hypothetical protein
MTEPNATGIVCHGIVLPGTERVIRSPAAWWASGERGTRPRAGERITRICGHWGGGHHRTGVEAAAKMVRAMKARKRADGSPMDVGIHFVISWDGVVVQTADLADATTHVGSRAINRTSIGVEHCWSGTMTQARKLGIDATPVMGVARGLPVKACAPSPELLAAWRWLVGTLALAQHPLLAIPLVRGSMTKPGVMEHCDVKGTTKVDCGGILLREVVR